MPAKVRKAVFPAAGLGTRFLPATKAQPKEMLPIVDKPIIQYGVEEALQSGIQNIIIVTGRGKSAIEDHFDVSFELEYLLESRHKNELLNIVRGTGATNVVQVPGVQYANMMACTTGGSPTSCGFLQPGVRVTDTLSTPQLMADIAQSKKTTGAA